MQRGEVVWNVEAFGATEEIILCPSLFAALTFWSHGFKWTPFVGQKIGVAKRGCDTHMSL